MEATVASSYAWCLVCSPICLFFLPESSQRLSGFLPYGQRQPALPVLQEFDTSSSMAGRISCRKVSVFLRTARLPPPPPIFGPTRRKAGRPESFLWCGGVCPS